MLRVNNKLIRINGGLAEYIAPPAPTFPSDMDFMYLANDFDGSKIPNAIPNSTFGDYLQHGTLTKNGSGSSCYLSNGLSDSNYLYKTLTNAELDNIKAINNTYTFFIRVMSSSGTGGIMSTRLNGGYNYMIRSNGNQLQIHTSSGNNLGTTNFSLETDRVYKVTVNGIYFYAKNLDNNVETTITTYSSTRSMGNTMTSFNAGYSGESNLSRFYALAGIPRATTAEEDESIKTALMNQSL